MRPRVVAQAEAAFVGSLLVLAIGAYLTWTSAVATLGRNLALGSTLAVILVPLAILLWATRGRSRIGLWLLAIWTAFSAWGVLRQVFRGSSLNLAAGLTLLQIVLMLACLALLFSRPARAWFARGVDEARGGLAL